MAKISEKELKKANKNYAKDPLVCARFLDYIGDKLRTTRSSRYSLDELWLNDLRMWSCRLDSEGYQGRSNLFVPEFNNQVESSVERAISALFPTDDYIEAIPTKAIDDKQKHKIKAAVKYELEVKNQLFVKHNLFERAKVIFGNGIYKTGFRREYREVFTRDKKFRPISAQIPIFNQVTINPVDNFKFYVFPETSTIETAELVFEDKLASIRDFKDSPLYENLDQVGNITNDIDHQWVDSTRLELMRLSNAMHYYKDSVFLTEVYCEFELTKGERVPVMAVIANQRTVVRLIRNPFWFQAAPYVTSRYNARPADPFYGLSLADKLRTQQAMINDLANQTMDSLNYIINPIAIIDPALAGDVNSMRLMPGARWLGSPEGIQFAAFPDVSGSGIRAMQEIRGQIAQFSDNTPGIAPQLQGKSRSATQASIVNQAVSQRQKMMGRQEEVEVLGPLCRMTHILLQQFMEQSYMIRIQGPDYGGWITEEINPGDLVADVDWIWKGVSEQENNAVRTQQLLAAFNMAMQFSTVAPGQIDMPKFFERVLKEGFGLKDTHELILSEKDKFTVDPSIENEALQGGKDIDIHMGDDDEEHIRVHEMLEPEDDMAELMKIRHLEKHRIQKQAKEDRDNMKAKIDALQSMQGMQEGGGQDGRAGPAVPSPTEGNQGQVASTPSGVFSSVQAQNNLMSM